ncbi:MAG: TIR domain-containing protein [Pirellulaceae bacterium]|nr:TIR domain-containing protein [Pirellulaceae bacterium]
MYHLLISGCEDTWQRHAESLSADRCLKSKEFTAAYLIDEYCQFTDVQNRLLTQLPAVFGYETGVKQDARLGRILAIKKGGRNVRIDYQFLDSYPPIPNEVLNQYRHELGIEDSELYRTHWALKDEDLNFGLSLAGFPEVPFSNQPLVNIREHVFCVALSFPGEVRSYTETIARQLVRILGNNTVFYDNFYKSQLAMPNLDIALQDLYGNRARLVVVFLSADYANKKWCGIEFRAIREIINAKQDEMVMFIRFDDAPVDGVFAHDGYIDANKHSEIEIASMIQERVRLLQSTA